jgi:hypothetical protein
MSAEADAGRMIPATMHAPIKDGFLSMYFFLVDLQTGGSTQKIRKALCPHERKIAASLGLSHNVSLSKRDSRLEYVVKRSLYRAELSWRKLPNDWAQNLKKKRNPS